MAAFLFSNAIGLVRQIVVANAFGASSDMEAFNAANRVAETLFNLVAGGALGSAFIPTFTALLARQEQARAWNLASRIANLVTAILTLLAALAAVFAPWLVRYVLAPGFAADPVKERLTIELLRIMLPSAVIFGLSGLVMGILNSHQVFLAPALAPGLYQLGMIFGVWALGPWLGIYGLAWGVVLGAVAHLLLQVPWLRRMPGRYTPGLDFSPDVLEVARLMGPRLLGVAVVQINFWINTRLASQFVEGSVTGVVLAFSLMLTPLSVIAQAIAVAAMPTFSAQAALGKKDEMRQSLAASLRSTLALTLPAALGLMLLRTPIVALLYQRGAFDARATELVSWALLWYAAGLVGHAAVEILARAFYAWHDTRTPVLVGVAAMSLNIVFSYLFSGLFAAAGWLPHGGLALANSVATGLEAITLIYLMRRRLGGMEGALVWPGLGKAALAAGLMSAALLVWLWSAAALPVWLQALAGVALGGGVFALAAVLLRMDETAMLISILKRRLAR
jgi:putative peptidoglycan lipid II flippase